MTTHEEAMRDIRIAEVAVLEIVGNLHTVSDDEVHSIARLSARRSREETEAVLRPVIEEQRKALAKVHARLARITSQAAVPREAFDNAYNAEFALREAIAEGQG